MIKDHFNLMMSRGITFPIYFFSDETKVLDATGMEYKIGNCEVRNVVFYEIFAITTYFDEHDNNKEYSAIYTNGTRFICSYLVSEVVKQLEKHLNTIQPVCLS